jgi:glutathione synthase/RimK-type ligase-like ATP-grasp enzyme
LCLASYFKGAEFILECKRKGARVTLLTAEKLLGENWPRDHIDEIHALPDLYNLEHVINGVSYLARTRAFDVIVALDDFDVETAARLREHLRTPGMGDTTARYFRDKLAMRVQARDCGIPVPDFIHVLNYDRLREFMKRVPPPWVLKPRSQASAIGIKKIIDQNHLWKTLEELGDRQSFHLLEKYVSGDVYHVDAIVAERKVVFAAVHKYGAPPMNVAHEGGIFTSFTMKRADPEIAKLRELNKKLIANFGLVRGVTHTEFIKSSDNGRFYFLETAARVGGAHIADLVQAATGVNLWVEWAKLEIGRGKKAYTLPKLRSDYAGLIITLARQQQPDTSAYRDPEITWRLQDKNHHVGLIVRSKRWERVQELLNEYHQRFARDFHASMPVPERPTS